MYPTISIGPLALPTYPLSLLVAFWLGLWLVAKRADWLGLDGDHAYNAGLYGLIAGILGARAWFVLSHWENYAPDITQAFSLSRSALSTGEGLIVAGLVVLIYLQRNRVPLGTFFDAAAPGLALALAIGNIGAFLGGEALGSSAAIDWAVNIGGTTRHPVQLYQAAANLTILGILNMTRRQLWAGFYFWLFVSLYGTSRLVLEIFRARPAVIGNGFLAVQVAALIAIVIALAVMAHRFTQRKFDQSA